MVLLQIIFAPPPALRDEKDNHDNRTTPLWLKCLMVGLPALILGVGLFALIMRLPENLKEQLDLEMRCLEDPITGELHRYEVRNTGPGQTLYTTDQLCPKGQYEHRATEDEDYGTPENPAQKNQR